jgi:hypothetical protein
LGAGALDFFFDRPDHPARIDPGERAEPALSKCGAFLTPRATRNMCVNVCCVRIVEVTEVRLIETELGRALGARREECFPRSVHCAH